MEATNWLLDDSAHGLGCRVECIDFVELLLRHFAMHGTVVLLQVYEEAQ